MKSVCYPLCGSLVINTLISILMSVIKGQSKQMHGNRRHWEPLICKWISLPQLECKIPPTHFGCRTLHTAGFLHYTVTTSSGQVIYFLPFSDTASCRLQVRFYCRRMALMGHLSQLQCLHLTYCRHFLHFYTDKNESDKITAALVSNGPSL